MFKYTQQKFSKLIIKIDFRNKNWYIYHKSSPNLTYFVVKKKTILFLEDEDELLLTLGSLLRDQRYNVIETKTAEDALKTLKEINPDLIIADIKLPGIDGFDFFHAVHQDSRYKSVPFIYLTAFNNLKAAIRAKEEGAADYITKPFDLEYLMVRIRELIPP